MKKNHPLQRTNDGAELLNNPAALKDCHVTPQCGDHKESEPNIEANEPSWECGSISTSELSSANRLNGLLLQKGKRTSSIEIGETLNKNNKMNVVAEAIDETCGVGEVDSTRCPLGQLVEVPADERAVTNSGYRRVPDVGSSTAARPPLDRRFFTSKIVDQAVHLRAPTDELLHGGLDGGYPVVALVVDLVDADQLEIHHPLLEAVLVDWCLERVEGEEGKIRVAGTTYTPQMKHLLCCSILTISFSQILHGNREGASLASRVFRSSAIVRRHDYTTVESEDGYLIRIARLLNIPKTRENGLSEEVCECFKFGFPILWHRLVNPKMELDNEHARSPSESTANAPSHSVEYYMKKFLSDSFSSSIKYDSDDVEQESMDRCSSEHEMISLPIECTSSRLGERGTPKCGKALVNLGITVRRLRKRSGKVFGIPSGGPMKSGHKQKKIQREASSKQMINEGVTSAADLTHENAG
ncbi:unnamed protein product [Miscanthus lutarioriparius]|uniref:SANTA domain-containing protein n=1 Tax=Miscanthus lutarioriparius TaxID=422564 RepID=A0A811NBL1_9POAL|nr:unnamed protein product [Miscanthus lutarioriparius]